MIEKNDRWFFKYWYLTGPIFGILYIFIITFAAVQIKTVYNMGKPPVNMYPMELGQQVILENGATIKYIGYLKKDTYWHALELKITNGDTSTSFHEITVPRSWNAKHRPNNEIIEFDHGYSARVDSTLSNLFIKVLLNGRVVQITEIRNLTSEEQTLEWLK